MKTIPITPWLAHKARPAGTVVDTIVLHSTAGASLQGDVNALKSKGFAYHYLIDHDGSVHKCAPADSQTAHAGNSWGPHEQAKKVSAKMGEGSKFTAGCSVNPYTVGVSFVNLNDGKQPLTAPQIASCKELLKELATAMPSLKWLTSHRLVTMNQEHKGRSRKVDPRLIDIDDLAASCGLTVWEPWAGAKDLPY